MDSPGKILRSLIKTVFAEATVPPLTPSTAGKWNKLAAEFLVAIREQDDDDEEEDDEEDDPSKPQKAACVWNVGIRSQCFDGVSWLPAQMQLPLPPLEDDAKQEFTTEAGWYYEDTRGVVQGPYYSDQIAWNSLNEHLTNLANDYKISQESREYLSRFGRLPSQELPCRTKKF